jgi:homoserine kinase type II
VLCLALLFLSRTINRIFPLVTTLEMAVFTEISFDLAADLVSELGIGQLQTLQGIASGIENTNYFADTTQGHYVLTVFERLGFAQLPFYLHLMKHLASKGIAVPEPQAKRNGAILHTLLDKPVAVVNRLVGSHQLAPDAVHCASVGTMLARMHVAGLDFAFGQPNLRGLPWWEQTAPLVLPYLNPAQGALLTSELAFQQSLATTQAYSILPRGAIHADLFRDNAMFSGHQLTGIFDFYFAGIDTFLFDIAVCINDWCTDLSSGRLCEDRANSLVQAYHAQRPLHTDEHRLLPALLRAAALRFWLSRLWDYHLPRRASMLTAHDPAHFERILRQRVAQPWHPGWNL